MTVYHSIATLIGTPVPGAASIPANTAGVAVLSGALKPMGTMNRVGVQVSVPAGGSSAGTLTVSISLDPASQNDSLASIARYVPVATVTLTAGAISAVTTVPGVVLVGPTTGSDTALRLDNAFRTMLVSYTNASGAGTMLVFASGVGP